MQDAVLFSDRSVVTAYCSSARVRFSRFTRQVLGTCSWYSLLGSWCDCDFLSLTIRPRRLVSPRNMFSSFSF